MTELIYFISEKVRRTRVGIRHHRILIANENIKNQNRYL